MELEEVERVAVLGAGNMGHGIAEVAALAGYQVSMRDIEEEFVEDGVESIEWSLGKLVENDRLTRAEADAARERIEGVVDLEAAVGDADVVVEAVPERMDVKKQVYDELVDAAAEEAVFATNTSSLSVTELSEATDRPERFCGMHFFNPPVRMDLVEVIAGAHTAEETLELIEALAESLDKTPVRVRKDSPGFLVNRVLIPPMNEAAWMVEEVEASVEEIDAAASYIIGMPMGVFELADQVGLDVVLDVLEYIHDQLGEAYEPCPVIEEKVEVEELGHKTDHGFYDYEDGGAEFPSDAGEEWIAHRLEAVMANEVAKLVGEDVAPVGDVDRAMQLGAGFPEGPGKLADDTGLDTLRDVLEARHEETGAARYEPSETLVELADAGEGFYGGSDDAGPSYDQLGVERDGRVGMITIDREHRMNSLTLEMLDEFETAIGEFEDDEEVRAVLIRGAGDRAFSAGADVTSMASSADPIDGVELSRRGHEAMGRIADADLPVVAAIDGYALGGGMELAAAADLRIATERSTLGQTEPNLGLMPGWGGTQRLPAIVGEGRAKEILLTGERYDAETMADYGFLNEVVAGAEFEERATELASDLAGGPPIAQRFIKDAVHAGRDDREAGLEAEAFAFGHLFGTEDLMEGITAFASDREPEFEGK